MGTFCCKAQSLSSIEELYIDQKSEDAVVVCINPSDNNSTIISYNDSLDYRPNFVYHTHTGTGVSKRFHWPLINNTFGEITYISQHPTWHRSDVEIHLVDDPSCAAYAIAAYECEDTAKLCENRQQTALFKLDFNTSPSPAISIAQLVYGYFRNPRTFVKIKNVLDDTTMVLLYRGLGDDGGMASTLLFPKWGHYGQIDGLLADYRYNTSIDIHKNRFIRLGGTSWIDKEVFHYNLDKRYIGSSCYSARPTFFSEKLQGQPSITYIHLVPIFIRTSAFIWIPFSMTRTSITKNSSCETNVYSK